MRLPLGKELQTRGDVVGSEGSRLHPMLPGELGLGLTLTLKLAARQLHHLTSVVDVIATHRRRHKAQGDDACGKLLAYVLDPAVRAASPRSL